MTLSRIRIGEEARRIEQDLQEWRHGARLRAYRHNDGYTVSLKNNGELWTKEERMTAREAWLYLSGILTGAQFTDDDCGDNCVQCRTAQRES